MFNIFDKIQRKQTLNMIEKSKNICYHLTLAIFANFVFRFEHQYLRIKNSIVWISRNKFEFNDEEVLYICSKYSHVWIINKDADIDEKCNIKIKKILFQSLLQVITKRIWRIVLWLWNLKFVEVTDLFI